MFYHLLPEDLHEIAESHHSAHVRSKTIILLQQKVLLLACTASYLLTLLCHQSVCPAGCLLQGRVSIPAGNFTGKIKKFAMSGSRSFWVPVLLRHLQCGLWLRVSLVMGRQFLFLKKGYVLPGYKLV